LRVYQFRHDRTQLGRSRSRRRVSKVAVNIKLSGKLQVQIGPKENVTRKPLAVVPD
jgi:hypothetical protein